MTHPIMIRGDSPLLFVADHASNLVPPDIDLGIPPALMNEHIAVDIGTDALTRELAIQTRATAVLAGVSRLVIDLNRETDAAGLIPASSDGRVIPGNVGLTDDERRSRIERFHRPYHDAISVTVDAVRPRLIVAMHSFTPRLAARPDEVRPWPVGILYNRDDRAAKVTIVALRAMSLAVGDNEPYSGRVLNYTMNRHAEAGGVPYINVEVRQDELATPQAIARWGCILREAIDSALEAF